jgi:hypothetical protein
MAIRMDDVISEYQKWKQQGDSLRARAKEAMEVRFRELLSEALQVAQEYQRDFGTTLKPPSPITTFRFKAGAKSGPRKTAAVTKKQVAAAPPAGDPKAAALRKRIDQVRSKLEAAKAAGKPTKNLEDRIYELEDELRLSGQRG